MLSLQSHPGFIPHIRSIAVARSKRKPGKPEQAAQAIDDQEETPAAQDHDEEPAPGSTIRISKLEAVRQAIEAGTDSLDDGVEFVRKRFGIEMTKPHFSAAKSILKKKGLIAEQGRPGRRPRLGKSIEGYLAPPPRQHTSPSSEILDALETMKPLIASLGKEQIHRMIDLLG